MSPLLRHVILILFEWTLARIVVPSVTHRVAIGSLPGWGLLLLLGLLSVESGEDGLKVGWSFVGLTDGRSDDGRRGLIILLLILAHLGETIQGST